MTNIIKMVSLTPLVFTVIVIGLFGISTAHTIEDVFAEKNKEGKNSNTNTISLKNSTEKCSPLDPRGC